MAFDGNFVHALCDELKIIQSGKINKIQQMDETTLIFKVRSQGANHQLLISAHPMYARFHLTREKYEFPFDPPMFSRVLRKHMEGGIIKSIEQIGNDRRVHITVNSKNEIGDDITRILILEIMGKHSNIIMTDEDYKIITGIKHLTPNNNIRTVMPGFKYEAPPTDEKLNPRTDEINTLPARIDFNSGKLSRQILKAVEGFSPLFIREIEHHAKHFTIENIVPAIKEGLRRAEEITPVLYRLDKDVFYFTKLHHLGTEPEVYPTLSALLDDYYHSRFQNNMIRQKAQDYLHVIEREYDRVERKIEKLHEDLAEAEKKDEYQKYGELITAFMHEVKRYDKEVTVQDYYTDQEVTIPLDPELPPSENAQKYYRMYNKLKNRETTAYEQLEKAHQDKKYFESLLHQMDAITTSAEVEEIREELVEEGILKFKKSNKKKKKQKIQLHEFRTTNGLTVFVGKNNKQNDHLTSKKSRNNHLWFHTKDIPGSHVVIAHPPHEIEEADILDAAKIAAFHSKAGSSESVPVDYTEIKHVHKISGAKPGFVTYTDQKTVFVTPVRQEIDKMKVTT
ncbi:Rqc2 family fibronectin-binding protein [Salinicoccus kekensis]|uniref:Rqc2 homolog RqcH n=1 Tax=Salinicoccus kekensis TaxID=714307 RepID=A0A285UBN0_9STAP|nr:NFACT RNA binding domain-containing protein [Salinicoccus kekensis]SOC37976.1 predicted ribosome quality control (RQC) complex YloA/Tae2 family protein [Salinicoccus kekensis]